MADGRRSRGSVVTFSDQKGYGFIKPDDGGDQLFVHQTAIKADGYRTLQEGQEVEFEVIEKDGRFQAVGVTGPNDVPFDNTRSGGEGRGYSRGEYGGFGGGEGYNRRNGDGYRGGGGAECYICGRTGHLASELWAKC